MAKPFDDLLADITREAVRDELIALAATAGLDVSTWEPGEPIWAVIDVFSNWFAATWNALVAPALRSRFLAYATGRWLSLLAWSGYNRIRLGQTFAGGSLTIENVGPNYVAINAGALRVKNGDGKTFRNVNATSVSAYTGGTVPSTTAMFVADEPGTASSTPIGGIVTAPVMSPAAGVRVVSNTAAWLGADEESDDGLRTRCETASAAMSPAGPRAAYLAAARDPMGTMERAGLPTTGYPETVNITRATLIEYNGSFVSVVLASPSGAASGTDVTVGTDVFYANAVIQTLVAPAGVNVVVGPATNKAINYGTITLHVRRDSLVTAAEAVAFATAKMNEHFATMPIGGLSKMTGGSGYVWLDHVSAVLQSGPGVFTIGLDYSATYDDVALQKYEVAVPSFTLQAVLV